MGFFKKSAQLCPLCNEPLPNAAIGHFGQHVQEFQSPDRGTIYGWDCTCGESNRWDNPDGAEAGLGLHMQQVHGMNLF